jgi:hypothetical protein
VRVHRLRVTLARPAERTRFRGGAQKSQCNRGNGRNAPHGTARLPEFRPAPEGLQRFRIGERLCSTTFAPPVADTSLWFNRRRGIAVAICASRNYLAGAIWPPILQY